MQILEDFLIKRDKGYYCTYGDFYIDPLYPVKHAIISHGHGDHASAGHELIYCTEPTAAFIKHRFSKQPESSFLITQFNVKFEINGVEIYLFPAGHILGSAQILMIYKDVRYLYTGDYKLQADCTCEAIEIIQADVLITETTFANPAIIHPDPETEIEKLNVEGNIMLGCYSLGKAQRLTALLNQYCPQKEILVHHNILPFHKIYDQFNPGQLKYAVYNRKSMKIGEKNKIYLVPPFTFNHYRRAKDVLRVFASGWKGLQTQNDISLYISDHVDWDDILNYIALVKPKAIWTLHGDGRQLHQYFDDRIKIRDIHSQTFLSDYC